MKTLLCLAVACVGLAGLAQAQEPATTTTTTSTTSSTTVHHHHHHHHMHRHHHHMHHHMNSAVTPQKPAAENPTAAPQ